MHIAQRKELDVHKTKQKRDRNRTTTSLVLDSSMRRGRWEFRLNQRIWLRLSSVFESRRISLMKIFLVLNEGTFTLTSSVQDLKAILKWHNFQSLEKALNCFMELKFCKSDVYFLNRRKNV